MAQNVTLWGASYSDVPALEVPKTGSGTASFFDVSDTTATASDVTSGKYFYTANGVRTEGTSSGGGGGTVVVTETTDTSGGIVKEITAIDITDTTAVASDVRSGKYFYTANGTKTEGSLVAPTPRTSTDVTVSGDTVTVPAGSYESQVQKSVASGSATTPATSITATPSISVSNGGLITASVSASQSVTPTVSAGYVSSGTSGTISVSGSNTSQLTTQSGSTISPSESVQTAVASGTYTTGDVKIGAISSTYVGSDIAQRDSTDLSASGATVSVPSGYYASNASKAVSSGTEGTPTATKGTVSSNSVSVTPSVTNSAGYISGGTKTGTAVTVSASELVSGNLPITSNGNNIDVTNYATVSVNVSGGGKNVQIAEGCNRATSSTYTDMGFNITVAKSGTYDVYWTGYRSSTSSGYINGAQLYINGSAYGNAVTKFNTTSGLTNTQQAHLSNVSLSADDKLKLYARSRGNNYYMYVMDLIIIES